MGKWTASARQAAARYDAVVLSTTLSPCMMCTGPSCSETGGGRENRNFPGNIDLLRSHRVAVLLLDDAECIALMTRFIQEHPELWDEDIAGVRCVISLPCV
jgi:cytosine deaminase